MAFKTCWRCAVARAILIAEEYDIGESPVFGDLWSAVMESDVGASNAWLHGELVSAYADLAMQAIEPRREAHK